MLALPVPRGVPAQTESVPQQGQSKAAQKKPENLQTGKMYAQNSTFRVFLFFLRSFQPLCLHNERRACLVNIRSKRDRKTVFLPKEHLDKSMF